MHSYTIWCFYTYYAVSAVLRVLVVRKMCHIFYWRDAIRKQIKCKKKPYYEWCQCKKNKNVSVKKVPNQQQILNKLLTELQCRKFANKHQLSKQFDAKRAKMSVQCVNILTELPFCVPPLVVGQDREFEKKVVFSSFFLKKTRGTSQFPLFHFPCLYTFFLGGWPGGGRPGVWDEYWIWEFHL